MSWILPLFFGYVLGSLNPAALISRLKKKDLRNMGTGNLGATNTALNFGKTMGALVMLFDIAKSALAVLIANILFPDRAYVSILYEIQGRKRSCGVRRNDIDTVP